MFDHLLLDDIDQALRYGHFMHEWIPALVARLLGLAALKAGDAAVKPARFLPPGPRDQPVRSDRGGAPRLRSVDCPTRQSPGQVGKEGQDPRLMPNLL